MLTMISVVIYMLISMGFGIFMMKRNTTAAEYFISKKEFGVFLIVPYIFSEMISGGGTIGVAQSGYITGISSVWVNWGMVLGIIVFFYLASDFYYTVGCKMNCLTVPEIIEFRYDRKCRILVMSILCISFLIMFASNSKAIAVVVEAFTGISWKIWSFVFGIMFIFVAITGGQKGVVFTNLLHSFIMLFGLGTACIISLKYVGGIDLMKSTLPQHYFDFTYPSISTVIAQCTSSCCSFIISSPLVAMVLGAKNKSAVKKGFWFSAIIMFCFALFPALIGITAKYLLPGLVQTASVIYILPSTISYVLGVVVVMSIVAALFSSSPAVLLLSSTMITNDLLKLFKPNMTDKEQIIISKIVTTVLGLTCTLLGMNIQSHLAQLSGAFQIRAIAGVVVLAGIYWGRVNSNAAFWSMLMGGIVSALWHFTSMVDTTGISAFWAALVIGMPILFVLTLINRDGDSKGYILWRKAYHESISEKLT
jgi:solute:Na+ symporter, SSS family